MDFSSAAAVRASLEFKQMKEKEIAGSCGTYFADCPRCGDPLELADAEESGDYPGILICHECKDEADSDPDCILDWNYAKVLRGETEY
jgi:hypothetical protein